MLYDVFINLLLLVLFHVLVLTLPCRRRGFVELIVNIFTLDRLAGHTSGVGGRGWMEGDCWCISRTVSQRIYSLWCLEIQTCSYLTAEARGTAVLEA